MVISDLTNPFFAELAVGIEDGLYKLGFVPILANTNEDPERQAQVLRSMREHGVAGIVMSPARGTDAKALEALSAGSMPMVITMRRILAGPGSLCRARTIFRAPAAPWSTSSASATGASASSAAMRP